MTNLKKTLVLMMFFSLASSWTILAVGQEPSETIDWKKLADYFIDISGWEKNGEAQGGNMSMDVTVGKATQEYKSGKRSLVIEITDSAKSMIFLMPIKMQMMNNIKTSQEYAEKIKFSDFPGMKIYDYPKKTAGLIILILDRFVVQMYGDNFAEEDVSELVETAKKLDLEGIAKLGK